MKETKTTSSFKNHQGNNIFYRKWTPYNNPKGTMIIVHGFNSHSGYYEQFANQLSEQNIETYALDLNGRGHSEGERFYIRDYKGIIADINILLNIASSPTPLPIFLFGHSAGAVFSTLYTLQYQEKLQGFITASTAFKLPVPAFALAAMKFLGKIIPHTRVVKLPNTGFSRDHSVVKTMNNDPLIAGEKQPAKTMEQLIIASAAMEKKLSELTIPLLVIHGSHDKITKPEGSQYISDHVSSVDKELLIYNGHVHDLLNDYDSSIVMRDIIIWVNERV